MNPLDAAIDAALLTASAVAAASAATAFFGVRRAMRPVDGELYDVSASVRDGRPEHFFLGLHGLLRSPLRQLLEGQPSILLRIVGRTGRVTFEVWIPNQEKPLVETLLRAAYPGVQLSPVVMTRPEGAARAVASVALGRGSRLAIRTEFEGDPLLGVLGVLAAADRGETLALEIELRPIGSGWQRAARLEAHRLRSGPGRSLVPLVARDPKPMAFEIARAKAIEKKAGTSGFQCAFRVAAVATEPARARELIRVVAATLRIFDGDNTFRPGRVHVARRAVDAVTKRRVRLHRSCVLTTTELAALWHLPGEATPYLLSPSPAVAPPPNATAGERVLGVSASAHGRRSIGLSIPDSRLHLHLLGPTGTGKTTTMLNLAVQDVVSGRGIGVLDPKGDLVGGVLERIPRSRLHDVVLISPDEGDVSVGINPLELRPGDDPDLVAENTLTIFKRIYERFWGMRTDDILKASFRTLLQRPGATLAHVPLLLTDAMFRLAATADVADLGLVNFWRWFDALSESSRLEAIGPVLNKLNDFLVRPRLRRLLCQPRSTVDLREVVDSGKILLADLSVGRWGESASELVGSFLVAKLWQAVLARAATAEDERRDFFLYLDEFQHFQGIGGPFADALAEARGLRLSLTLANQHLAQLPRDLREAIASNARSRAVFQCGPDDAASLAREFAPLDAAGLRSLGRFELAVRLAIDGQTSSAFTLRALPPTAVTDPTAAAQALVASRRYSRPRDDIDRALAAALGRAIAPERGPAWEP